jgi:RNA polymerase sigma-70 factor (ECF subfamily)
MALADPDNTAPTERDLVQRAKRGDVSAFEALYRQTSPRVFALCMRMRGDHALATEALQDVYVRVWERLSQFDGRAAFSTWLHRVCVNQLLEQQRRDSRREARVAPTDLTLLAETAAAGTTRDTAGDADIRIDLERALPHLSEAVRMVFVLHDMHGFGHGDIATMLGVAEPTVRVQLHRARKQLMEILNR